MLICSLCIYSHDAEFMVSSPSIPIMRFDLYILGKSPFKFAFYQFKKPVFNYIMGLFYPIIKTFWHSWHALPTCLNREFKDQRRGISLFTCCIFYIYPSFWVFKRIN